MFKEEITNEVLMVGDTEMPPEGKKELMRIFEEAIDKNKSFFLVISEREESGDQIVHCARNGFTTIRELVDVVGKAISEQVASDIGKGK